jgi:methylenetetrahydrofolate reductase (NADPH)
MNSRSQSYWERKNNVIFPKDFRPDLTWSVSFAKKVMDFAERTGSSLYVMPIKTNLEAYLAGIFG